MLAYSATIFIYFGGIFCFLLALGKLVVPREAGDERGFQVLTLSLVGAILIYYGLYNSRRLADVPYLIFLDLPLLFFAGPFLNGYLKRLFTEENSFKRGYLHIVPGVLSLLVLWPFFLMPAPEKIKLTYMLFESGVQNPFWNWVGARSFLAGMRLVAFLSIYIYLLPVLRFLYYIWKKDLIANRGLRNMLTVVIGVLFLVMTTPLIGILTYQPESILQGPFSISCLLVLIYTMSLKYGDFFDLIRVEYQKERYGRSMLEGLDTEEVLSRLARIMEEEKAFADEDLSLEQLAAELEISLHQLSELINTRLGKNFKTFLREYRVKEACNLLLAEKDRSVLSIAFAVGFRSKSAFNSAFVQVTGKTPTVYRKGG